MRIGLDIDGVLADFAGSFIKQAQALGYGELFPDCTDNVTRWDFGVDEATRLCVWKSLTKEYWLNLPVIERSRPPLPIEPAAYITSRWLPSEITAQWLRSNGFPKAKVISVHDPLKKLQAVEDEAIDLFVDDHADTVRHLIDNGKDAVLFRAPWQATMDCTGLWTINHLGELL